MLSVTTRNINIKGFPSFLYDKIYDIIKKMNKSTVPGCGGTIVGLKSYESQKEKKRDVFQ